MIEGYPGGFMKKFKKAAEAKQFVRSKIQIKRDQPFNLLSRKITKHQKSNPKIPIKTKSKCTQGILQKLGTAVLKLCQSTKPTSVNCTSDIPKPKKRRQLDDHAVRVKYNIPTSAQTIYTDGACYDNGKRGARAGFGVFFSVDNPKNISGRLPGPQQTNQRAELYAVLKALESIYFALESGEDIAKTVYILSDSEYVVKGLTIWAVSWERSGWTKALGSPVVSSDLFKRARDMMKLLGMNGVQVCFQHVPGHRGIIGNEEADRLAVRGSWLEPIVEKTWDDSFDDEDVDEIILSTEMEFEDIELDQILAEIPEHFEF
jgi:ribonuclease HI